MNGRVHWTTGCVPAERLSTERRFLRPLPRRRYDTAYAEPRRVHVAVPLVHWKGVRYSVTPACIGQLVSVREEVGSGELTVTWARRRWDATGSPRRVRPRCGTPSTAGPPRRPPSAGPGRHCVW